MKQCYVIWRSYFCLSKCITGKVNITVLELNLVYYYVYQQIQVFSISVYFVVTDWVSQALNNNFDGLSCKLSSYPNFFLNLMVFWVWKLYYSNLLQQNFWKSCFDIKLWNPSSYDVLHVNMSYLQTWESVAKNVQWPSCQHIGWI